MFDFDTHPLTWVKKVVSTLYLAEFDVSNKIVLNFKQDDFLSKFVPKIYLLGLKI